MSILFDLLKFIIFTVFLIIIPGYLLIRRFKFESFSLNLFLSLSVGWVLSSLLTFIFGYLNQNILTNLFLVGLSFLFFLKGYFKELFLIRFAKADRYLVTSILVIVLGTVFQNVGTFRTGLSYNWGIGYWGPLAHDGLWHQALITQIVKNIPPVNPIFSGELLSNYHYFYDILVAATFSITRINIPDLIFRYYPLIFSLMVGLGTYHLVKQLFKKEAAPWALYFVYFSSSFGWIVEWIRQRSLGGESAFWANQMVSMNLNPPFAISLIMVIAIVILFNKYRKDARVSLLLPLILLCGTLIEFKVYVGLIVLGSLFLFSVEEIFLSKTFNIFKLFLGSLALSLLVFLPQNSGSVGLVQFSPLWFVHSMIESTDRVGWLRLAQARQAYLAENNWIKLVTAEFLALIIFIAGNLGTRILGVPVALNIWRKEFLKQGKYCFVFFVSFLSFLVPLLFVQKGNPWNTIQFFYYFLFFASLFTGYALYLFVSKQKNFLTFVLVVLILLITPISSFSTFRSYFLGAPARLSSGEVEALEQLADLPEGVVLTYPFDPSLRKNYTSPYPLPVYETSAYVSAFSTKVSFLEDEIQQQIFQSNFGERKEEVLAFFSQDDCDLKSEFIHGKGISYIYLPKVHGLTVETNCPTISKVFENQEALIYKTQ